MTYFVEKEEYRMTEEKKKETQLHEVLAVERQKETHANKILDEAKKTFKDKGHLFEGHYRKLDMYTEEEITDKSILQRQPAEDEERQELGTTVSEKLDYIEKALEGFFDVEFQKEKTNQLAKADIIVSGKILARDIPATYLLFLERELARIRGVYDAIPTLDITVAWEPDTSLGRKGAMRAKFPIITGKTTKIIRPIILAEATDKHPAQVKAIDESVEVGKYTKTVWSGRVTPAIKSEILARIDLLLECVKKARTRANHQEVIGKDGIGKTIFNYLNLGELKDS